MVTRNQLDNIHKIPLSDVLLILNECTEALGVVDMNTASSITCKSKRRIYQLMNDSNSIVIGSHKFICVNLL